MAEEKTTVKGLNKAIQSVYDKLNLRIRAMEEQAKIVKRQKGCIHEYLTAEISMNGGIHKSKCAYCGVVFLGEGQFDSTKASRKNGKKIHEYLISRMKKNS